MQTPLVHHSGPTLLVLIGLVSMTACAQEAAPPVSAEKTSTAVADETRVLLQTFVDELVSITPGEGEFPQSFQMGSEEPEVSRPVHTVTFKAHFRIAKYETPQNLYEAVLGLNPSRWRGPRNSAEQMTFDDAERFCQQLTDLLRREQIITADDVVRLPSEAEWEYCCRAGTTTNFSFGDNETILDEYAWHAGNAAGNDPEVGSLKPNPWGLYDMHGYLREFCADNWHGDYTGAPADGSTWVTPGETSHVLRGGSWEDTAPQLMSAYRRPARPGSLGPGTGFRCVLTKGR